MSTDYFKNSMTKSTIATVINLVNTISAEYAETVLNTLVDVLRSHTFCKHFVYFDSGDLRDPRNILIIDGKRTQDGPYHNIDEVFPNNVYKLEGRSIAKISGRTQPIKTVIVYIEINHDDWEHEETLQCSINSCFSVIGQLLNCEFPHSPQIELKISRENIVKVPYFNVV